MVVPTSESCDVHGRGEARILPDAKRDAARKETLLDPLAAESKRPSWFLGILIPLIIVGFAVWFGFIKQDIVIGGSVRSGSPAFDARGPAAIWGGVSTIAIALGMHAAYFWARIRRFRTCAQWAVGLAILLFLGATLAAAVVQDRVEEHGKLQLKLGTDYEFLRCRKELWRADRHLSIPREQHIDPKFVVCPQFNGTPATSAR
jgi:hypothetical protein